MTRQTPSASALHAAITPRTLALLLGLATVLRPGEPELSPAAMLEQATYLETAAADPDGAIAAYESILQSPRAPHRVAAQAHLRLGVCYLWKGDSNLSRQHLETVADKYASESDLVRSARRYLGQPVMDDPSSFYPEDILLYAELLDLRENIRGLSTLLEGTPFQNPVDYYVSTLARAGAPRPGADASAAPAEPRQTFVREAAAFLNEGFLREMQLVESLAVGLPGGGAPGGDYLAVLDPGASNILRGLVQMGLTISGSAPVGTAHDTAVFRLPAPVDDPDRAPDLRQHLALGNGIVLLGSPRKLVEEAVERGGNRIRSLADSPDFRLAKEQSAGGILFAYVGARRFMEAARKAVPEHGVEELDAVAKSLGLERFRSIGIALTRVAPADALHLEARARLDTGGYSLWNALASSPLPRDTLRAVPADSVIHFSTRFDHALDRIESMYEAAAPLLELLAKKPGNDARRGIETIHEMLRDGPARSLLEEIEAVTLAIGKEGSSNAEPSVLLSLELRDGEKGGAVLEGALTSILQQLYRNPASKAFGDETLPLDGQALAARYVEPSPGARIRYVRLDRAFVISPSAAFLSGAARAHAAAASSPHGPVPPSAGKLLVVRPSAIVEQVRGKGKLAEELELLFGEIDRVTLSTREDKDGVVLDITIPQIFPTTRSILNRISERLARKREKP